jgi:hypothetical protein
MTKIPEDQPKYLRELERCRIERQAEERRKQVYTERLVELIGAERRAKEDLQERSRQATRRAKDTLLRTQHIADKRAHEVMRKGRGYATTKYPWEP